MPRIFVNRLANFAAEGGMVSFSLQDAPAEGAPETVADVIMRERDFLEMLGALQNHVERRRATAGPGTPPPPPQGPRLGNPTPQGGPSQGMSGPMTGRRGPQGE